MKKVLLLMATLFTMGVNSWAGEKVYANLSALTSVDGVNATWNGETNTMSWIALSNNMISNFNFGMDITDLSAYESITIKYSELNNGVGIRVQMKAGDKESGAIDLKGNGEHTVSLADFKNNNVSLDLTKVQWIRVLGSGWNSGESNEITLDNPASVKLEEVYLTKSDINYIKATQLFKAPAGTTDIVNLNSTTDDIHAYTGTEWTSTITYPKEFKTQGAAFGNGNGDNGGDTPGNNKYVDISAYDYLCLNVTSASSNSAGLRVWIWDDQNEAVITLYAKPIADYATADYTQASGITGPGTYVCKVTDYKYLKGIKSANDWSWPPSVWVSMAYMTEGAPVAYPTETKYRLVGEVAEGSATLAAALNDPKAVLIDATGVTGTDVDLYPGEEGNPNCIFLANEGALANAQNVCVDGNIENLFITDGYPVAAELFNGETTYNFASFFREEPKKIGTLCLPFGVSANDLDHMKDLFKFYTVSGIGAENAITLTRLTEITAGVPCIVEKLDDVDLMLGSFMTSPETLEPATPQSATVGSYEVEVIGSYKQETIAATGASMPPFYYGLSDGEMVQALESITVNPFRAYVKLSIPKAAPARLTFAFAEDSEEATAIKNLAGQGKAKMVGIYSVNGAQQKSLQQGMNVVKFSDGTSQKVLVK